MRSILQLVGGVAVAGVVAAGSTAFTGFGASANVSAVPHLGGTFTQAITGATLTTLSVTNTTPGQITAFVLGFVDTPNTKTVALTTDGSASGGATTWTCGNVSSLASTCTINAGYMTNVGTLTITVS